MQENSSLFPNVDPRAFLSSMMQSEAFVQNMMQMFGQHYMTQMKSETSRMNESAVEGQRDFGVQRQAESSSFIGNNWSAANSRKLDNEQGQGIEGPMGNRRGFTPLFDDNPGNTEEEEDVVLPGKSDFLQMSQNEFLLESEKKSPFNISRRPAPTDDDHYNFQNIGDYSAISERNYENQRSFSSKVQSPNKDEYYDAENSRPNNWDDQPIKPMAQSNFHSDNGFAGSNPFDEKPVGGNAKNFEQLLQEQLGDQYSEISQPKEDKKPPKKEFLKKGTRKFLSSAKDKDLAKKPSKPKEAEVLEEEPLKPLKNEEASSSVPKKRFLEKGKGRGGGNLKKVESEREKKEVIKYEDLLGLSESDKSEKKEKSERKYQPSYFLDSSVDSKEKKEKEKRESFDFSSAKKGNSLFKEPEKPLFDDQESLKSEEEEDDIEREYREAAEEKSQKKSKIVEKYFSAKNSKASTKKRSTSSIAVKREEITQEKEEEIVRKYVNEKIESLNAEIAKFKSENERVKKVRLKYEGLMRDLNKEMEAFKKKRQTEIEEFETLKAEELKKLKKEKKAIEAKRQVPTNSRKDREEIENLKAQLAKAEEEHRAKESRQRGTIDRLKRENDELQRKYNEIKEELKVLERSRIVNQPSPSKGKSPKKLMIKENIAKDIPKEMKETPREKKVIPKEKKEVPKEKKEIPKEKNIREQLSHTKEKISSASEISTPRIGASDNEVDDDKIGVRNLTYLFPDYDFNFSSNEYYLDYQKSAKSKLKVKSQNVSSDGKIQRIYEDGKKEILFQNGVKREAFPDGFTIVHFTNGDIKQTLPDGTVIYYFADAQTTQTTLHNGPNIYRFPNQQIEVHMDDGGKEIRFADGTEKFIKPNGEESTFFVDGTVQKVTLDKMKIIQYTNGQKDTIHPDGTKTREFPDGRVRRYLPNSGN